MSVIERVLPFSDRLPDAIREMLVRRLRELAGLVMIALASAGAAAFITWSVQDPSLSHATSKPIHNILGYPGAIGADLLMQILGLGSIMLILPIAIWGWRLLTHRHFDREALRVAAWLLATLLAAGFASCFARTGSWPLPTGLGGVAGDALLRLPAAVFGATGILQRVGFGLIFGAATTALFMVASGIGSKAKAGDEDYEEEAVEEDAAAEDEGEADDERSGVPLGMIVHALLSTKARIGRAIAVIYRWMVGAQAPTRALQLDRREPNLGQHGAPSLAPAASSFDEEDDADEDEEDEPAARAPRKRAPRAPVPKKSGGSFTLPAVSLLTAARAADRFTLSDSVLQENAQALEGVLDDFGVHGEIINVRPGPVVTLYELEPAPGIKSSRVIGLADDIARSMSALAAASPSFRAATPSASSCPTRSARRSTCASCWPSKEYAKAIAKLPLCLGKTIGGEPVIADLARMPHLLIAGTTGSGKSVAINTMILSLLYRLHAATSAG